MRIIQVLCCLFSVEAVKRRDSRVSYQPCPRWRIWCFLLRLWVVQSWISPSLLQDLTKISVHSRNKKGLYLFSHIHVQEFASWLTSPEARSIINNCSPTTPPPHPPRTLFSPIYSDRVVSEPSPKKIIAENWLFQELRPLKCYGMNFFNFFFLSSKLWFYL